MKKAFVMPLLMTAGLALFACKKSSPSEDASKEEAAIDKALIGFNYKIATITDQNGNDSKSKFPACILDDTYYFKDRGTVVIIQNQEKCGEERLDSAQNSWGVGIQDGSVSSLLFPIFYEGQIGYKAQVFYNNNYSINYNTGALKLSSSVNGNVYTISLVQYL